MPLISSYHIVQLGLLKLAEHFTDAITAAATVAVAVFTYTLKKSTDKMWDAGERQIAAMRNIAAVQARQMKASIREMAKQSNAAKAASEAALRQVEITKIGVVDLERAYLAVGPTQITTQFIPTPGVIAYKASDPLEVSVTLFVHNTGRTGGTIKAVYGEFSTNPPFGTLPVYLEGQHFLTDLSIAANKESVLPFEFKTNFIGQQFFWGYIEYDDIFKNRRTSRFCVAIVPGQRTVPGGYQIAGDEGWRASACIMGRTRPEPTGRCHRGDCIASSGVGVCVPPE